MSNVPKRPSPVLYSLLILGFGLLIAFPFMKGRSGGSGYESVRSKQPENAAVNSAPDHRLVPMPVYKENSTAEGQSIPSHSLVKPNGVNLPSTGSSKAGIATSPTDKPAGNGTVNMLPPRPVPQLGPSEPKPASESMNDVASKSTELREDRKRLATDLPTWAKKPSLLDSLVSGKEQLALDLTVSAAPKRPGELQAWTQPAASGKPMNSTNEDSLTTGSPFSDSHDAERTLVQNQFRWPDEEPHALAVTPKPRSVGRDAIIRDEAALAISAQAKQSQPLSPEPPSLAHRASAAINAIPSNGLFPHTTFNAGVPAVGAKLRSRLPPASSDYIRQPH